MSVLRAERVKDRFGEIALKCPLCGHIFYSGKQYTKHLYKSHLTKVPKKVRVRKKLLKYAEDIKSKGSISSTTRWKKVVEIKAKLLGNK